MKHPQAEGANTNNQATFSAVRSTSSDDWPSSAYILTRQGSILMLAALAGGTMLTTSQFTLDRHSFGIGSVILLCFILSIHLAITSRLFKSNNKLVVNFLVGLFASLVVVVSFWGSNAGAVLTLFFIFWLYHMTLLSIRTAAMIGIIISLICCTASFLNQPLTYSFSWLTLLATANIMSILTLKYREKVTTEFSRQINQLEKISGTDELTGLLNRRLVVDLGQRELQRAKRTHQPLSVMMADLDSFKLINDNYGHLTGDRVLQKVSRAFLSSLRATDLVGRFGGDEFLIILPQANLITARKLATRLLQALDSQEIAVSNNRIKPGMSVGIVAIEPSAKVKFSQLVSLADDALYCAKNNGRNKIAVQFFENS
ncbi:MAG: GGDEF domain-containing protein [Kangiellaceae bacterium]|nr:GGDEF domain-containing protein [Kangiellaceae bacterium]MCW9017415.1 GGDEF domain-containing protein [Kangiellaceae bacterium]